MRRKTTESFIQAAREKYGDRYDYSKVDYKNNKTKVCIICKEHGEFWQRPNDHLSGYGCPRCSGHGSLEHGRRTTEEFVEDARKVHGDKYDYSKVEYNGVFENVLIICREHGEFWQRPNNHLNGSLCPKCAKVVNFSRMAQKVYEKLLAEGYEVEKEKTFDWLVFKRHMKLDFFLPMYNVAVEVQGGQHFRAFDKFGGERNLEEQQERDEAKRMLCEEHGIKLFYITQHNSNIDEIKAFVENMKILS
jgi:hypothetical protein